MKLQRRVNSVSSTLDSMWWNTCHAMSVSIYGYGSIPINSIFRGMNIIYQLFWCSPGVQGFDTLPYFNMVFASGGFHMFLPQNRFFQQNFSKPILEGEQSNGKPTWSNPSCRVSNSSRSGFGIGFKNSLTHVSTSLADPFLQTSAKTC